MYNLTGEMYVSSTSHQLKYTSFHLKYTSHYVSGRHLESEMYISSGKMYISTGGMYYSYLAAARYIWRPPLLYYLNRKVLKINSTPFNTTQYQHLSMKIHDVSQKLLNPRR